MASTSPTSTPPSLVISTVPDSHTTDILGKEDPVTFTGRVDTDIVLGVGGMRTERLDDERVEGTGSTLDFLWLTSPSLDPRSSLFPFLVQTQESSLSSSLDELIGLTDELGAEYPFWETGSRSDRRDKGFGAVVATCQLRLRGERG